VSDLIDTTEMFLKAIYEINEAGALAIRARLSERLHQALPSVSQTVTRLEREGLVTLDDAKHVILTKQGEALAIAVLRKHRLAERLLFDVLGFDWADCHEEACRWEHVISDEAEVRIAKQVSTLNQDPYGNPIPGLDALGLRAEPLKDNRTTLINAVGDATLYVAAIGETAQALPGLLVELSQAGIQIESQITAELISGKYVITSVQTGQKVEFSTQVAEQILIKISA
jgi:DtxR family Mn-dependent transcriptional regulator